MPENAPTITQGMSARLDCEGVAFGHGVAREFDEGGINSLRLKKEIELLRANVLALVSSDAIQDKDAKNRIDTVFYTNDQLEFNKVIGNRLGDVRVLDWLAGTDDASLVTLARWNVERRRALQVQLDHDRAELVEMAVEKTDHLVDIDFFPVDALRRMQTAAYSYVPFKAMDSFESGAMNASGYFDMSSVTISNQYGLRTEQADVSIDLASVVFHELLHGSGNITGGGFIFEPKSPMRGRLWEEAFVTHSAEVAYRTRMGNYQLDTFNPFERVGIMPSLAYGQERQTMGLVSSLALISPRTWAAAFFSNHEEKSHQRLLAAQLGTTFEFIYDGQADAFSNFNRVYEYTWSTNDEASRARLLGQLANKVARLRGEPVAGVIFEDEVVDERPVGWFKKVSS